MGFGSGQKPTKLNQAQITQSAEGYAIPAAMGTVRVQSSLLFQDGWGAQTIAIQGGKGGGKGGTEYLYYTDVIAALCNGPILGIGDVWSNSSWLGLPSASETYTIASPGIYTPSNAVSIASTSGNEMNDIGVGAATSYSSTHNDVGAPTANILSGSFLTAFIQVAYGTTLTTGTYSVNPASVGTFVLTSVANASGGNTVYTGTITGGAANAFAGYTFTIAGFTTAANNGSFICASSTATTLTLQNASGVAQTHAATATEPGNTYHFDATHDAGKTLTINYNFYLPNVTETETDLVPAGKSIVVGGSLQFLTDLGVVYPLTGVRLTAVSTAPTVTGTYQVIPSGHGGTYKFATGDIGAEVQITWITQDLSLVPQGQSRTLNFQLFEGTQGQAAWSVLTSKYPGQAQSFSNTAYVAYHPMALGTSGQVSNNTFEVVTPDVFGGGVRDCNPVQCIGQILTNQQWGLGAGTVPFPSQVIDNGASGTWGSAAPSGTAQSGSTAWNWFAGNSFFVSLLLDSQDTAASVIGKVLEAGSCPAFYSEGLLKLVPKGDTSTAAYGCTWVAPTAYVVALDDTCYVGKEGEDPVKITRSPGEDAMNTVRIQWNSRANQYSPAITQESDQASINTWGERKEDPQNWDFIHDLTSATFAAIMRVKDNVYIRNTYEFTLPFTYSYLEPMDIITVSTTSIWAAGLNNANLGLVNQPVRITKIVDDATSGLSITCEDYPWGAHLPTIYNKSISTANVVSNAFANPGNVEVVMFEATSRLTGFSGNEIWIGVVGTGKNYGSCNIWVSRDNTNFEQVGTIQSPARMGALHSTFASGSDPDTTNSLVIDLAENCGALTSASTADADNDVTLCFVDGEYIAYSAATLSGQQQYTMGTYIRRGLFGTTISSHAAGSLFMRLDQSIFKYQYDPTWAGQTLYFKFQAVNNFGNSAVPLANLTATSFVVPGKNPGTIDASSGLVLQANYTGTGHGPLAWTPVYTSPYVASLNIGASAYSYAGMNTTYASGVAAIVAGGYQYFYNRFTGYLVPTVTGEYTIGLNSDDGANLYIGGQQVGTDNLSTVRGMGANLTYSSGSSAKILLTAGVYYPLVVEWEQNTGNWGLQLLWTLPVIAGGTTQIIPAGNLSISSTSVTSSLNLSIWQGSSGLWYPNGTGLIDPANKTLYGPPNAGGGTNVVNSIVTSTNHLDVVGVAGNTFTAPGWIVGQLWSSGSQMVVIVPSASTLNHGYIFNFGMNIGSEQCYIVSYSGTTGATGATQANATGETFYAPTNPAAFTGWWNFAIYIGANGYMAAWVNGNLATDAVDVTYAMGTQAIYYCQQAGWAQTFKIAPAPLGTSGGSSFLNGQASIIPNQPLPPIAFSKNATSISLSWNPTTMILSDGSTLSVAGGSKIYGSVGGGAGSLSASTTYNMYPYIDYATLTILFTNGSPPDTSASSTHAIQANEDGRFGLPPLQITTSAVGGSGSGGGGGAGCPESSELVDVEGRGIIQVIDVAVGDFIKGRCLKTQQDVYRKVVTKAIEACAAWRIVSGHKITAAEPIWTGEGYVPAMRVPGNTFDDSVGIKVMLHVDTDEYDEANYWLVSGEPLLTHNQFIGS